MNLNVNIPTSYYIICVITMLITGYAIFRQIYLVFKKVPYWRTWKLMVTWLVFAIPAVTLYTIITQLAIYPKYVKVVKLDLTHSSFESDMVNDIIKYAKQNNAACVGKVCTMNVLDFQHTPSEVLMKVSNESTGITYCGVCASPINFDFTRMKFVAHVIFK